MEDDLDTVFAALADPTRRAILAMLLEDDMAVTDVAEPFRMSLAGISKHLVILTRAGDAYRSMGEYEKSAQYYERALNIEFDVYAVLGLAVIAPTGSYDSGEPASAGLGYWSGMLTLGATYYLDSQRTWSISALTRTLVHTEQDETDVTPGSELVVEYGIGKEFRVGDRLMLRPGLAGSAYWQLEDDSDNGPEIRPLPTSARRPMPLVPR